MPLGSALSKATTRVLRKCAGLNPKGNSLEGAYASTLRGCAHGMVAVAGWNLKILAGLNPEGNSLQGAHAGLGRVQVRKVSG